MERSYSYSYSYSSSSDSNNQFDTETTVNGRSLRFRSIELPNSEGIELIVNGQQSGLVHYITKGDLVTLKQYVVEKGYNTCFLRFMTEYFINRGLRNIDMYIKSKNATDKLNFWIGRGFRALGETNTHIHLGAKLSIN